jgi:beta-glucosidase
MHRVAADDGDAGAQALAAGLDVELPDTIGFGRPGRQVRAASSRGAGRPRRPPGARQKVELGLSTRTGRRSRWRGRRGRPGLRRQPALAREWPSAPSSCSTPDRLPLLGDGRAAPRRSPWSALRTTRTFMGCYAFPTPSCPVTGARLGVEVPTRRRLRAELPGVEVVHERAARQGGTAPASPRRRGGRDADLCVAMVGDLRRAVRRHLREGCDAEDLRLPGVQAELLDELLATGTPVVVVVVSGRPYALGDVHGRPPALVQAFMPGEEGGAALAGVLSGRVQPSGKLPVQIPGTPAASRAPTCSRRSAPRTPGRAASTHARCSRSGTAARTPRSSSPTCGRAPTRCRPTASSP